MTFPANYAVIAEDELTYVTGGNIWDALPAVMTSENWRTFGTNMIKIVGNTFLGKFIGTVLGTAFGSNYVFGNVLDSMGAELNKYDGVNAVMQVLGGMAAVYTLGTNDQKLLQADQVLGTTGTKVA